MRLRLALSLLVLSAAPAFADPAIQSEGALISASGPTVSLTHVPVILSSGAVVYRDVTITLSAGGRGHIGGDVSDTASPPFVTAGYISGDYYASGGDKQPDYMIHVSGPTPVKDGMMAWSASALPKANNCTTPVMATWYVGDQTKGPYAAFIHKNQMPTTGYAYGLMGPTPCGNTMVWTQGDLIGVQQTGDGIAFTDFNGNGQARATVAYMRGNPPADK